MTEIPENKPDNHQEEASVKVGGEHPKFKLIDDEVEKEWLSVLEKIHARFGSDIEMEGIVFLIGVQELGLGYKKFKKDEKLDVMHIAICTLLEPYGYYQYEGKDSEGWPHWKINDQLPALKPGHQKALIKQAMIEYFKDKL